MHASATASHSAKLEAAAHSLHKSSSCAHSFASARCSLHRRWSIDITKYQSDFRTTGASHAIFSASLAAARTSFAALSDRSPCTICMSLVSSTPRAPSPGRIRSSLASRLSCRRYPSRVPSCRPRTVVASKFVPYSSAIAASSLSRAAAHGHSRSLSSSSCVPPAAPSPASWLRSHFLRPLHPCFSLSNHQWWPPHSGHAVFGGFSQLTQSHVFLLRKWRFPSIHLNSG